ncbi:CvpA family protein [Alkalilimnicola sp. S0819]|uniref:CvpA family protein n=1 Tax=Alkalilimnicola sp. S0819 TaxID=2613922 RepID=UPI001261DB72|nr:CvpA family protein [Alkalilimnicola sp. S0819]KAB7627964.1 CvpA family protein [Alkalilimnicola sp. S0819]MPQ15501.1 CvpA family protein [Alkalilimnicola sp. S0819]
MTIVDLVILGILALSALISLLRGFVREVMSVIVWVAAVWIGVRFAGSLSVYLVDYIASPSLRMGVAFVVLFVATLLLGALINHLASQLVSKTGLSGTDRMLGVVFGVLRGVLVVGVLVLLAGLTALPQEGWWRDSRLIGHLQRGVCAVAVSELFAGLMVYSPVLDGQAMAAGRPAASYWSDFCAAAERPPGS